MDTFRELWGTGEKLSGLKVSYKVDDGEWKAIGQLNGVSDVAKFRARGYRVKFLLEEVSKNNLFELHTLDMGYTPAYVRVKGE